MKLKLLSTLTMSLLAACAQAAEPKAGIDTQYVDASVRAQDDFFLHVNGTWLKTVEIPSDHSSLGSFDKLHDDVQPLLRGLIEGASQDKTKKAGSISQKIGDYYASFMDEPRLESLGYKPLAGELQRIHALRDKKGVPALIAHLHEIGVSMPYAFYVGQDARESTRYAVNIYQSGLGMPDRDYYLKKDDAKLADTRAKYEAHIAKMLSLAGRKDGVEQAKAILALETALAEVQWTRVASRDPVKRYNKMSLAELSKLAPGYDWKAAMAAAGVATKVDYVIVSQPSYLSGFDKVVADTNLDTLKAYFEWQLLRSYAKYLSKDFVDANFAFYGTVLTGTTEMQPRWKRGVAATDDALGEAVGKLYVEHYFPAERKARMETLVKNLLAAFKESIDTLDWMGPETKKQAQAKLAKFTPKIAYPDKWRDYSSLDIKPGNLVGNVMRAAIFDYRRDLNKLGHPIDRSEWGMTPQTINAYYNATMNEIVFPAAILQPPFFTPDADDAVNYGAIGAVIGHEISHGFDDGGSQSDGDGNLRDWWTKEDRANFTAKTKMLADEYSKFEPVPGYHVNGELTLGENIGDNSGVAIAYKAYKISLGGKPAPVIDGLTGEQRFYLGWGQVWRGKMREARQIALIKSNPHAPDAVRVNGTLVNQPGFYEAFDVKEGDKMYVAPKDRVIIW